MKRFVVTTAVVLALAAPAFGHGSDWDYWHRCIRAVELDAQRFEQKQIARQRAELVRIGFVSDWRDVR